MKIFITFLLFWFTKATMDVYLGSYSTEITRWKYSKSRTLQFVEAFYSRDGPSWELQMTYMLKGMPLFHKCRSKWEISARSKLWYGSLKFVSNRFLNRIFPVFQSPKNTSHMRCAELFKVSTLTLL